jgi:MFS family permease
MPNCVARAAAHGNEALRGTQKPLDRPEQSPAFPLGHICRSGRFIFSGLPAPHFTDHHCPRSAPGVRRRCHSPGVHVFRLFLLYAAVQPPVGILSDTWGPRTVATLFTFVACIGVVVFGLAPNMVVATIGRALIGIGVGGVFVPAVKIFRSGTGARNLPPLPAFSWQWAMPATWRPRFH